MSDEFLLMCFIVSILASLASLRTVLLAWFRHEKLKKEIEGRAKILTSAYPPTNFWLTASVNKIRLLTSLGFLFILSIDIFLYVLLFGK